MESGLEFLDEFLQLGGVDVANRPEALCVPTSNVESLHFVDLRALRSRRRCLRDEEIDHMHPAPVDDGSDRLAVKIVRYSGILRQSSKEDLHAETNSRGI